MLQTLKIERFKSIRNVQLDLGRVNLFIGGNGAGKSNILEAIGLLSASLYRGVAEAELTRKGVRLTPPSLMKAAFKNARLPKTFRIEAGLYGEISYSFELTSNERDLHVSFFSEHCEYKGSKLFGRSPRGASILSQKSGRSWDRLRSLWDQSRVAFDFPQEVEHSFDALARFAIYAPQTEFLREIRSGLAADPPIGLHGEGLAAAVQSLIHNLHREHRKVARTKASSPDYEQLRDAIDLVWLPKWAESVKVGKLNPLLKSREMASADGQIVYFIDKFMHEKRNTLSAYDSSEGTLFLLFMAVLLSHEDSPAIFALDNVDSALNPSITRQLIETMIQIVDRKSNFETKIGPNQIFMTSHNPTALDAFDLFDADQRVFVVRRNENGHSVVTRLKPKEGWTRESWASANKGKKLSQLWIDGDIKGALGQSIGDI